MFRKTFVPDLLAGLTVSFAAIALGAAFGTMSGRGAFAGMMAAAVIPIITSLFGGTRLQASGPTAPMTAVSALLIAYAYEEFAGDKVLAEQFVTLVFMLSAVIILLFSVLRIAKLIELVPQVVIFGFMNGIALLIWVDQIKKLFGWGGADKFAGNTLINVLIALGTLALIYSVPILLRKYNVRKSIQMFLPGALVGILVMTLITSLTGVEIERVKLGASIDTFSGFTQHVSMYFPGADIFKSKYIVQALPYALELSLLSYLDSLLTALVIDKMTGEKSKLNKELFAQGLGNIGAAIVQGIPGAQATIRSVLLIKEGAQTRLAGVMIGVFALLGIIVFKDYLTIVTAAVFVGVLFKAGADVFDFDFSAKYFTMGLFKYKTNNYQFSFVLYTTLITILIDLNVAVISGTILFYLCKRFLGATDYRSESVTLLDHEEQYNVKKGIPIHNGDRKEELVK
ncbi:MAG: SulP family inorganic anion transporter [Flammeovirgaceae bacterium]|nr:SulP family inorganic anion transporter [Flammeovirgaceae bacterium]